MSTTAETLKHGTELVADTTLHAATELAERARKQAETLVQAAEHAVERLPGRKPKPRHRGRRLLLVGLACGAAGWAATKGRRMLQERRQQQEVFDRTLGDGAGRGTTGTVTGTGTGTVTTAATTAATTTGVTSA